jgi:predicted XRE-type DNA-binding protein
MADVKTHDLGPDNIYAEFGLPDADERLLKATLITRIRAAIVDRKLTRAAAGKIMGLPRSEISELVAGGATGFSAERLIHLLNTLGVSVSITLREEPKGEPGGTFVHFDRESTQKDEISPEEAAIILGIHLSIVHHRMDNGKLPFSGIDTHRRVLLTDVLHLKEAEDQRREFAAALGADTEDLEANYAQPSQSGT